MRKHTAAGVAIGLQECLGMVVEVLLASEVPEGYWAVHGSAWQCSTSSLPDGVLGRDFGGVFPGGDGMRGYDGYVVIPVKLLDKYRQPETNEWGEYAP